VLVVRFAVQGDPFLIRRNPNGTMFTPDSKIGRFDDLVRDLHGFLSFHLALAIFEIVTS
jgi:hypothetical protein